MHDPQRRRLLSAGMSAALLMLGLPAVAKAAPPPPQQPMLPSGVLLSGHWTQGGVLLGQAPPGTRVWFGTRSLRMSEDGRFVFGLHRDAAPRATLKIQLPGDAAPQVLQFSVEQRTYKIQRIDGLPDKMVSPPPAVLERIRRDQQQVARARSIDSALTGFAEAFIWPCIGPISGVYGSQRILNGVPKQPHYGVDVAQPVGTPVVAPASGVVTLAEPDLYYTGGTIMIDHGHGLSSVLMHLSKVLVEVGQGVRQGEKVAEVGATGRVTGAHLDWRMNWFDARIDPQLLVPPMPSSP